MEKLTKQQIVLVTLLVSFVTSIATGIVTVALMDQAPPGVTQTINRVVERTVEKVVTEPANNTAAVVTRETIVVKEDDKIVESVDKNKNSIVRIYTKPEGDTPTVFVGLGTIVSKDGLIVTGDVFSDVRGKYTVSLNNNFYNVTVLPQKKDGQFYFLKVNQDEKAPVAFTPVTFSDSNSLKLGQTVIAWGGATQNAVSTGIISSLVDVASTTATTTASTREIMAMSTNINLADSIAGGPLLNLYGEVVGLRVSPSLSGQHNFLPANILKPEITSYASVQ
ncbi:MAG: serine protease [Candidatus Paceibacterota bacterium]